MKRNPDNTNQHLFDESTYQGYEIQTSHGPLIEEHLSKTLNCFQKALKYYTRVCMMRFDLHVPDNYYVDALSDNNLISKFIASLRSQILSAQNKSRKQGHRVHDTDLRYTWCREVSTTGRVHYHVSIFLNYDAYAYFGEFNLANDNMYTRLHKAWASALGYFVDDTVGLIHIPDNGIYLIHRDDVDSISAAFFRASYACKMHSKEFGNGFHTFGSSRI